MPNLTYPGVYIDESTFPTFVSATPGNAVAAFVGTHSRGPTTPTQCNGWNDFIAQYGGFDVLYPPSALALAVWSYFSAGGTSCLVIRVVSSSTAPVSSTLSFNDSVTPIGSSNPTLRVVAKNPGIWGNNIFIDLQAGNQVDGNGVVQTFTLVVKYGGTGNANLVERWENLTMVPGSLGLTYIPGSSSVGANNYAPDIINSPLSGSKWITVTDLASPATGLLKNPPVTSSSQQLATGTDGAVPSIPDIQTAMQKLDQFPGQSFILNLPGAYDVTDIGNAISYAESRGDVFVVADPPQGMTPAAVVAFAKTIAASTYCAMYYPWLQMSDPYAQGLGRIRTIAPGGSVMGIMVSTDNSRGVAKAPAGLQSQIPAALNTDTPLANADIGTCTQGNVNPIISLPGSGVVVFGARTLSNLLQYRYVPVRRTMIYLKTVLTALTKFAVFEPNDYILWNGITAICSQFLLAFWQSGGLRGTSSAQAFYVICDGSNNTQSSISQGIVNITVGVALQSPAEFVVIKIGQSSASTQLTA